MVEASASADVVLRTGVASLVTATMLPLALVPNALNVDRDALAFYRALAEAGDATASFPRPKRHTEVQATRVARWPWGPDVGRLELLRFESPFVPLLPAMREPYARHKANRTAVAQYWRHDHAPRPTLAVIHGFMGSPYFFNSAFFELPWFYRNGYDVLLYTLPFHGRRAGLRSPYSGYGYFAHGMSHMNEAMGQAVCDFRVLVDHLESLGVDQIGVTGLSLGGYTTALLAATEERLRFAIPNAAVTDLPNLVQSWFPAGQVIGGVLPRRGIDFDELAGSLAVHSPLTYAPLVPYEGRLIIAGLGDRLAPPEQSEALWEHWGRCALHWFPGNHVLHVNRGDYLREMGRFLKSVGFGP